MTSSSSTNTEQELSSVSSIGSDSAFEVIGPSEPILPSGPINPSEPAAFGWTPSILTRFPSPGNLLAALRRRWFIALCFGLMGATIVGGLVWSYFVPYYHAEALIQTIHLPPDMTERGTEAVTLQDFSRQQAVLIRSPQLLEKVVDRPEIKEHLSGGTPEELRGWLLQNLSVDEIGDKATVRVRLSSTSPHLLKEILASILTVYYQDQLDRQADMIDRLRMKQSQDQARLASLQLGVSKTVDPQVFVLRDALDKQKTKAQQIWQQLLTAQNKAAKIPGPPTPRPRTLPPATTVSNDPRLPKLKEDLDRVEKKIESYAEELIGGENHPSLKPYIELRESLRKQIASLKNEPGEEELPAIPDDPNNQLRASLAREITRLEADLSAARKEATRLEKQLTELEKNSPDLADLKKRDKEAELLRAKISERNHQIDLLTEGEAKPSWMKSLGLAVAPSAEHQKKRLSTTILGAACGFIFWTGAVGLIEFRRRRLTEVTELSQGLDIPLLGTIPPLPGKQLSLIPSMWENREDPAANRVCEAVDVLRTLLFRRIGEGPCVVMVTSAVGGEGKTSLACELALSLAKSWRKTLLVDADLRKPGAHQLYHLPAEPGLSEVLRGEVEVDDIVQSTPMSRLWMVPAGQWDSFAVQSLAQERAVFLFEHFRKQYDFVIVDGGPILSVADALLTAQHSDAVIMTAREQSSRLPAIHTAHERLLSLELPVLGCIVINSFGEMGCLDVNYP